MQSSQDASLDSVSVSSLLATKPILPCHSMHRASHVLLRGAGRFYSCFHKCMQAASVVPLAVAATPVRLHLPLLPSAAGWIRQSAFLLSAHRDADCCVLHVVAAKAMTSAWCCFYWAKWATYSILVTEAVVAAGCMPRISTFWFPRVAVESSYGSGREGSMKRR